MKILKKYRTQAGNISESEASANTNPENMNYTTCIVHVFFSQKCSKHRIKQLTNFKSGSDSHPPL